MVCTLQRTLYEEESGGALRLLVRSLCIKIFPAKSCRIDGLPSGEEEKRKGESFGWSFKDEENLGFSLFFGCFFFGLS